MQAKRVTFYPCGGVGLVASSVTRLTALKLGEELLPGRVDILDMHQLVLGVEREKELATRQPVMVMDGCNHQCGSNFLWLLGIRPALRFFLPGFAGRYRLKLGGQRAVVVESARRLAELIARNGAALARRLLEDDYPFRPQALRRGPVKVCDFSVNVEQELAYIDAVEPCIHRPEDMPPVPGEPHLQLDPPPEDAS